MLFPSPIITSPQGEHPPLPSENPEGNPWAGSGKEGEGLFCTRNLKKCNHMSGGAKQFLPLWTAF